MAARIRMNGVDDDNLIPTPPVGKATLFYNNVFRVYRAKLDDGTSITLSSDPEFIQDTISGMFQDSSTIDFTYDDAGNVAFVEVIQSALDISVIPNTPSGNLTATNVQDALNELQSDVDLKYDASNPSNYIDASGAPVQSVNTQTGAVILDADNIDDSATTNKFATQAELDQITTNESNITSLKTNAIIVPLNGGLLSSGTLGSSPTVELDFNNLTFAPIVINPLEDRIAFLDDTDGDTKSTLFQFAFDLAVPNNTAITSIVSADASIDTHSDVDTTTTAPNNFTILVWDGSNWVPANAIGANAINLNKQIVIDFAEDPQTGAAIIVNASESSGDAFLFNNANGNEVFSIRSNVLDQPNVVLTRDDATEIAVFNQNGLRLNNSIYINELSNDETFADESINAVVSERAIKVALDTKENIFNPNNESVFFDDFDGIDSTDNGWQRSTNGSGASVSSSGNGSIILSGNAFGVFLFDTGSTSAGRAALSRSNAVPLGYLSIDQRWRIKLEDLSDAVDEYQCTIGFSDQINSGLPTDGIYFFYTHALGTTWRCVTRANNVQSEIITTTTVDTNFKTFKILINEDATEVEFFINEISQGTLTTNIPSGAAQNTRVLAKIEKLVGTTQRNMYADYYYQKITIPSGRN